MPLFLHLFSIFISDHWRSSAVETQSKVPAGSHRAARLIGRLFASRGLKSGHGDPSLFHWLRLGARTSFRAEPVKECLTDVSGCEDVLSPLAADA